VCVGSWQQATTHNAGTVRLHLLDAKLRGTLAKRSCERPAFLLGRAGRSGGDWTFEQPVAKPGDTLTFMMRPKCPQAG
jgi:hypothetical protein